MLYESKDRPLQKYNYFYIFAGGFKRATSGTIFYGNACAGAYLFLCLAKEWPTLTRKWRVVELSMKRYGQPKLFFKFITIATLFMSLAFSEYDRFYCFSNSDFKHT